MTVASGQGHLDGGTGATGPDGIFQAQGWVAGATPGDNVVQATTEGLPGTAAFTAVGLSDQPASVSAWAGDGATGYAGNFVAVSPAVRVLDGQGRPVAGPTVGWEVIAGNGTISASATTVDADGVGTLPSWRWGLPGPQMVRATVAGQPPVTFHGNAAAVPPSEFGIEIRYSAGPPTHSQDSIFHLAAARWGLLVVGDLTDQPIDLPADPAGCFPALHETVDDLVIFVELVDIDGAGGILGASGACLAREEDLLPAVGILLLDRADVFALENRGLLADVMVHEMGHILGFTETEFRLKGLYAERPVGNPLYLGPSAQAAYAAVAPAGTVSFLVPLENSGGPGTRSSHWRESILHSELMTGYIDPVNRLSAITVAVFRDLGYRVNDLPADPFDFATLLQAASRLAGPAVQVRTSPWNGPLRTIDRHGRVVRTFR